MPAVVVSFWVIRGRPSISSSGAAFFAVCFAAPAAVFVVLGSVVRAVVDSRKAFAACIVVVAPGILLMLFFPHYLRLIGVILALLGLRDQPLGPAGMLVLIFGAVNGLAAGLVCCGIMGTKRAGTDASGSGDG